MASGKATRKKGRKLSTHDQSEKAILIEKLYAEGENLFGSIDAFNQWMNSRIPLFKR